MASVYIPLKNSKEEVRVQLDQLPQDASDICHILNAEKAPLHLWLTIAREYFKQGKIEQFVQILEEGSSPEIDKYYSDVRYERIAILNALGAYYTYLGKVEPKQVDKDGNFTKATQYYNKASRIDMHEPSTWIGKGQLLLAKGDIDQAFSAFKIVLDGNRDNVPALLGQACIHFNRGRYSESLELYKRALRAYPLCPAAVRLGLTFCRYKLGQYENAKQAFERVLALDPENVEALVALGILDLQKDDATGIRRGMERMQRAFEIYPYCAQSLNYLANHFFFTGQHFLVEQLTETALAVTKHGPTTSHSYYNLARLYHSKEDYEKAGLYYMASVKEINRPQEFPLPYFGLGKVQLKLGDFRSSLANFEKVLEVHPENCDVLKAIADVHVQMGEVEKAMEFLKKATKNDQCDAEAFLDLGELLISTNSDGALEAFITARSLLEKGHQEVSVELFNNIGALHLEKREFELAEQTFMEGLGDGIWITLVHNRISPYPIDVNDSAPEYKDMQLFHRLEEDGFSVEVPWDKITLLTNLARLFERLHNLEAASILYRLILFKHPDYVDSFLGLASIAKARNNIQISIELVYDALNVDPASPEALLMLGDLEMRNDQWIQAKETYKAAKDESGLKDSYATLALGNWNYFAAIRAEKIAPMSERIHLEKAKDLFTKVLQNHNSNVYAANGAGVVLAETGHFKVSQELFKQVREAASASALFQIPDVLINMAHLLFAQGSFFLAVETYQNCLREFYYGTDSEILLYIARTHYEAEQWQDCKKNLLRAIHLAPTNYTLKFIMGVAMQKISASTLQKPRRTVEEVRLTVLELQSAVRVFSQLLAASNLHFHGFHEKIVETHVNYCTHLLKAAIVHCEAAEMEEQRNKQRLELARQVSLAEEARRKAEDQMKFQMERRKQEDELKQVMRQEEHVERMKEHWKSSNPGRCKDKNQYEDEVGGQSEKKLKKGGRRRKGEKGSKSRREADAAEVGVGQYRDVVEYKQIAVNYKMNDQEDEGVEERAQNLLAAASLENSNAEGDVDASSSLYCGNRAWSELDVNELQQQRQTQSSPQKQSSSDMQISDGDGGMGEGADELNADAGVVDQDV